MLPKKIISDCPIFSKEYICKHFAYIAIKFEFQFVKNKKKSFANSTLKIFTQFGANQYIFTFNILYFNDSIWLNLQNKTIQEPTPFLISWFMNINCWCCCCCCSLNRFDLSLSALALEDEGDTCLSACESLARPVCPKLANMLLVGCWLLNWFSEAVVCGGGGSILATTLLLDAVAGLPRVLCKNRESSSRLRKSGSAKTRKMKLILFWNKKINFLLLFRSLISSAISQRNTLTAENNN